MSEIWIGWPKKPFYIASKNVILSNIVIFRIYFRNYRVQRAPFYNGAVIAARDRFFSIFVYSHRQQKKLYCMERSHQGFPTVVVEFCCRIYFFCVNFDSLKANCVHTNVVSKIVRESMQFAALLFVVYVILVFERMLTVLTEKHIINLCGVLIMCN